MDVNKRHLNIKQIFSRDDKSHFAFNRKLIVVYLFPFI